MTATKPDTLAVRPQLGLASQKLPPEIWSASWSNLVQRYGQDQVLKHMWDWEGNQLVPHYDLQQVKSLDDVWKEYTVGLNGFLPLRELKERWTNPSWHQNLSSKKTPASRRKKITDLIRTLSKRSSPQEALKYLNASYDKIPVDTFARKLQKTDFIADLIN